MSKTKEARELITLIRKVKQGLESAPEEENLGTAAALLALNHRALYSDELIDILHEYLEINEVKPFVLGQEVLCPDGIGRISEMTSGPGPRIRVETHFNNRSCLWDVQNIKRWPQ